MINVIGIAGSPRRKGNSTTLLKAVLAGAAGAGARTETVYLNDLAFGGCQACGPCAPGATCRIRDGLTPVLAALRLADVWVLASPIYFDGVCGQLKTFFDRCFHLTNDGGDEKPQLIGKRAAALIATYEAKPRDDYRRVVEALASYLKWMGQFDPVEIFCRGQLGPVGAAAAQPKLLSEAEALGKSLVERLAEQAGGS